MNMKEKAEIIVNQLGGAARLKIMIGANRFIYSEKNQNVWFNFKGSDIADYLVIKINGNDLYDMDFIKTIKDKNTYETTFKTVKKYKDVYAEDLIPIFESTTGLYLRL